MIQFEVRIFVKCFEFNHRLVTFWPLNMNWFGRWNSWDVFLFRGKWPFFFSGSVPSWELTYHISFWRWLSFSSGGICYRSLEGIFLNPWICDFCWWYLLRILYGMGCITIFPPAFQGEDFVGTSLKPPKRQCQAGKLQVPCTLQRYFFGGISISIFSYVSTSKRTNKGKMSPRFLTSEHISSLYKSISCYNLPVEPHEAVAEVSKIGNV